jgi:hypothetical protein
MVPGWHRDAEWRVEGYFRLRQIGRDRWKKRRELRWEDMEGRVLAVDGRVQRDEHGRVVGLHLEVIDVWQTLSALGGRSLSPGFAVNRHASRTASFTGGATSMQHAAQTLQ